MTKDEKDTKINIESISSSTKKFSPEEHEMAQRACDEFEAITLGKKEMTMKDLYELKIYARKRTDITKNDDELSPEQIVWKALYSSVEKLLVENLKPEVRENLDNLQNQMDSLGELLDSISKIIPLGQEIETEVVMQRVALTVYFDKGPENNYKAVVDGVTTDLVDPKKWSPDERMEKAQTILKIIDANREYLYKKQLVERQETVRKKLRDFDKLYSDIDSAVSNNRKVIEGDPSLVRLLKTTKEWLHLTKELYSSRTRAISAVKNSIEADEFIPKLVLEKRGDVSGNVSITESLFELMSAVVVLINKANEDEELLAKKREPLSEELFGKSESYIKFPKEDSTEEKNNQAQSSDDMGIKTKWFIVIALSIVALSGGIWTAIGVFILGAIIVSILSK